MKVIIPMAGYGTRLRPHTFSKPKPLINVAGKPVLGHVLDMLAGVAVEEYIFVTGYRQQAGDNQQSSSHWHSNQNGSAQKKRTRRMIQ